AMGRERVERSAHGAVADRVQAYVEVGVYASLQQVDELRLAQHLRAGTIEHLSRAAAERPVEERFHAPDPDPLVAPPGLDAEAFGVRQVGKRKVVRDAERQLAAAAEAL